MIVPESATFYDQKLQMHKDWIPDKIFTCYGLASLVGGGGGLGLR